MHEDHTQTSHVIRQQIKTFLFVYSINLRIFRYFKAYFITEMHFLQKIFWKALMLQVNYQRMLMKPISRQPSVKFNITEKSLIPHVNPTRSVN
jgi:hypothetical protein